MTNFERLKQIDVEELANFIDIIDNHYSCRFCGFGKEDCEGKSCVEGRKIWLMQESETD